ncbi:hypothetical protein [Streptomyces sp. NPDC090080]|uniref:hypothetical protein n=1 Tax=Streptomyces sp. NPDC090080 TaxID=3365939 RepID=UPI0037F8EC69
MPTCDYFSATDDQAALDVLHTPGGPARAGLDVAYLKNIDPVVAIARLEALLTGCTYEEASRRPRSGQLLSDPDDGSGFIVSLTDTLTTALANATHDTLHRVAEPWSQTDELQQTCTDAEYTADVLEALAALAQRAHASGRRLYCRWSL